MLITNKHASFYLWWKKKIGKVSKSLKILCLWLHFLYIFTEASKNCHVWSNTLLRDNNKKFKPKYRYFK